MAAAKHAAIKHANAYLEFKVAKWRCIMAWPTCITPQPISQYLAPEGEPFTRDEEFPPIGASRVRLSCGVCS